MAGAELVVQTPFANEVFRSGTTLAVSASFHRGQPGEPGRTAREVVVSLLDEAGREVGTSSSSLDPNHPVAVRDVGLLFLGYPVMLYAWPQAPEGVSGRFTLRVRYRPRQGSLATVDTPIRIHLPGQTPLGFVPADASQAPFALAMASPAAGAVVLPGEAIDLEVRAARDSKTTYFYHVLYNREQQHIAAALVGKPPYRMVNDPERPGRQAYQYGFELKTPFEKLLAPQGFALRSYLVSMQGDAVFQAGSVEIQVGEPPVTATRRGVVVAAARVAKAPDPEVLAASVVNQVDINADPGADLVLLRGIGRVLAGRIVARRPFASIDDLSRVPGLGTRRIELLRPALRI